MFSKAARQVRHPLKVLFQEKGLAVIDKPAGLICQFGPRSPNEDKLSDRVEDLRVQLKLPEQHDIFPVHRLDKQATGSLLLATTQVKARDLSRQFKNRTIDKSYLALVSRHLGPKERAEGGRISLRLVFDNRGFASVVAPDAEGFDDAVEAITEWEWLAGDSKLDVSLLRLHAVTGYKHQLRLFCSSYLEAPIVGDTLHHTPLPPLTTSRRDSAFFSAPQDTPLSSPSTSSRRVVGTNVGGTTSRIDHFLPPHARASSRNTPLFLHCESLSFTRYIKGLKAGTGKAVRETVRAPVPGSMWAPVLVHLGGGEEGGEGEEGGSSAAQETVERRQDGQGEEVFEEARALLARERKERKEEREREVREAVLAAKERKAAADWSRKKTADVKGALEEEPRASVRARERQKEQEGKSWLD